MTVVTNQVVKAANKFMNRGRDGKDKVLSKTRGDLGPHEVRTILYQEYLESMAITYLFIHLMVACAVRATLRCCSVENTPDLGRDTKSTKLRLPVTVGQRIASKEVRGI
ncbi:hypothetical protein N7517_008780 [Penicillium concentricum]|uniref:Uncharacterized protein n=1 Tax=Penicillium concentricum TaxID=293559 RepID=A0A9W9RV81_9EURO|nr:uncharacterized protein N7517_008780 [Penicillium concentricum]KAJ5365894.1 hypothetical protein N7517_008780 [Penicillium concentricum]